MKKLIDKITTMHITIGSIISILIFAWGIFSYNENRYAYAERVFNLEQRFEYQKDSDKFWEIQKRIWKLEDRYENRLMPASVKEEYRKLEVDLKILDKKLNPEKQGGD